ncbi:MAG TPA: tetratricopeptide repeat protein [Rhizomicrobium sp.]|jgi:tetratricopeptide (TPR) repeat protein
MKKIAIATLLVLAPVSAQAAGGYGMLNAGIDYFNQNRYDDAIIWLGKALDAGDLVPDQAHVAHLNRGVSLLHQGQAQKSIDDFSAALVLVPDESEAIANRAFAYLAVGEMDHAVDDLNAAHKKRPTDLQIDKLIGLADWQLGRYAEAREVFIRIDTRDATAWFWQQLSNVKLNRAVDPIGNGYAPLQWPNPLRQLYTGQTTPDAALKFADANKGQACDANFYVGEWLLAHGDKSGAKPLLEKAVSECPNSGNEPSMAAFELRKMAAGL